MTVLNILSEYSDVIYLSLLLIPIVMYIILMMLGGELK